MAKSAVLLIAALSALATAAPFKSHRPNKASFKVAASGRDPRSPLHEVSRAYHKYGFDITTFPSLSALDFSDSSVVPRGDEQGTVTATPQGNDRAYLEEVTVGGQQLTLNFDTGSSDLWVFSTATPSSESAGHTLFNPTNSSSWEAYDGSWSITYGDHSTAAGTVGFTSVEVGGVTATRQAVELATTVSSQFANGKKTDGLMGLGFSSGNQVVPQKQQTFWENVMSQLEQPVFTADLDENAAGSYTFGSIDSSKYTGDILYADVDSSNGYWEFSTGQYAVGNSTSQCTTCSPAIADTGTSIMFVDPEIAQAFYAAVEGAEFSAEGGGYAYPCDSTLPDLAVSVGSFSATLNGADLTYSKVSDTMCYGGVQSNSATSGKQSIQIYGDVFLKQFYAVFDGGNSQFGVALKA